MSKDHDLDVNIRAIKKIPELAARLPLLSAACSVGDAIRRRVRATGTTASGGTFKITRRPLRAADDGKARWIPARWLDADSGTESVTSKRNRNRWAGVTPLARSRSGKSVLAIPRRIDPLPTSETQTFDLTGTAWDNLKGHLTSAGRVRVGFAGTDTPGYDKGLYGKPARTGAKKVRNAAKMWGQNQWQPDELLEPSEGEVQAALDGLAAVLDDNLRAVFRDGSPPMKLPRRGDRRVWRNVVSRRNPLT